MKIISLLTAIAFGPMAFADFEVRCAPMVRAQGTVLSVEIETDSRVATVAHGAPSFGQPVRTEKFQTVLTESDDLQTMIYSGESFQLVINETQATAQLSALLAGIRGGKQLMQYRNLKCQFNMFNPHPGVSASN